MNNNEQWSLPNRGTFAVARSRFTYQMVDLFEYSLTFNDSWIARSSESFLSPKQMHLFLDDEHLVKFYFGFLRKPVELCVAPIYLC